MLRSALATTVALAAVLAAPAAAQSCTCHFGADYHGNPIDPASTYCGFRVCGADDQYYECTTAGWQAVGGGPCGTPPSRCACSGGTAFDGTEIDPDATFCGMQICGLDDTLYECRPSGWHGIGGGPCGGGDTEACAYDAGACSCPHGALYNPHGPVDIPVEDTYCGMTVCGVDNQYYECTADGWDFLGGGPCFPDGTGDADGDSLTDGLEQILMARFAPKVRLHINDRYRPSSVDWYLDRVHMRYHHGFTCPDHQILDLGQVNVSSLVMQTHNAHLLGCDDGGAEVSSSGTSETDFFLQIPNDDDELRTRLGSTPEDWTCYAHVLPSLPGNTVPAGRIDVQYWFFYPYNGELDGTEGSAHEGDWEHVTVRLDGDTLEPLRVYLAAHEGGDWHDWNGLRCTAEDRPVVYSAVDSHATFEREGSHEYDLFRDDHTSLLGPVWDCADRVINLGERPARLPGGGWIAYNGRWGEVGGAVINASSGPYGPALKDKWDGVED